MTPAEVTDRLAQLRVLYEPEHIDAARERLAREVPEVRETFACAVSRRLDELRALDALTRHLQQRP